MPYLNDLASELRTRGKTRFLESYPSSSVLVGMGIIGVLLDAERTPEGTLRISIGNDGEYLRTASLVERVWFLVKKPGHRGIPRIILGRTSEADVSVPELSISIEHCAFEAGPFGLRIADIESTNGTMLNGTPLQPNCSESLRSHDKIVIGRFEFEYLRHKEFMDRLARYSAGTDV
jgi:hypothetical protein